MTTARQFVAFSGTQLIARGPLADVAVRAKPFADSPDKRLAFYADDTGQPLDVDLRGDDTAIARRAAGHPLNTGDAVPEKRDGPGRPKLGVVSREVSLLPRHWDWLGAQRGGASAALRRLVEDARRNLGPEERMRQAMDAAYRFLWDIAGDLPGFEEVSRALSRKQLDRLGELTAQWPDGIREQLQRFVARARAPAT